MCGLAVIYRYRNVGPGVDRAELMRIREQMKKRGPDDAGLWISEDGRIGMAHRRLSIIDTSAAGRQPMPSRDGRLHVVFNGEIYNYRELRERLGRRGFGFNTESDTEVLLAAFDAWGPRCVDEIRGMFAFAIWDARDRRLFLARDPFGIKPLYFAAQGGVVRVASQVKALLASGNQSRDPEPAGMVGFYCWGSVPEPWTLYRGCRALEAGSYIWVDDNGVGEPTAYYRPDAAFDRAADRDEVVAAERIRGALLDSMRAHLVADVPVGLFLSAGIDSTVLVALASEVRAAPVRSVTLAFEEFAGSPLDERPLAEEVARRYCTEHTTHTISRRDFEQALPQIIEAMDQPSIDGVNTYFVSRAAAESGLKVALSGLGGDELFGGYPAFRNLPRAVKALSWVPSSPSLRRCFRAMVARLPVGPHAARLRGLLDYGSTWGGSYFLQRGLFMPWEIKTLLDADLWNDGIALYDSAAEANKTGDGSAGFARTSILESSLYMRNQLLRDSDWAGMAHALEIRTPLVDRRLHDAVAALCAATYRVRRPKRLLAAAARPALPETILSRPKSGFGLPMQKWLRLSADQHWAQTWAQRVVQGFV